MRDYILNMRTDPTSVKEVQKAIAKLKNGNAICVDKMHREILKVKDYWPPAILTRYGNQKRRQLPGKQARQFNY